MKTFDEITGQDAAIDLLRGMLRSGRVPHAILLQGPVGVGKATTAEAFTSALLCESPDDVDPCGVCESCRLLASASHPDRSLVRLQAKPSSPTGRSKNPPYDPADIPPEDLSTVIRVEQIRDVTRLAGLAPRVGRRRVFLIDPADQMNRESQNSLLKTLEEPAGDSVLLLVASRPHLLLPTVRSRCFQLRFAPLRTDELAGLLQERLKISRDEALTRAALSGGRIGIALDAESDLEQTHARRAELLEALEALADSPTGLGGLSAWTPTLAGKTEPVLVEGLELVQSMLRDAARAVVGHDDTRLVHADLSDRLFRLGERLGAERAAELVRGIDRLRGELRFNLNRNLVAETVLAAVAGAPIP